MGKRVDDPHTGRPVEVTSEEMYQKFESLILQIGE